MNDLAEQFCELVRNSGLNKREIGDLIYKSDVFVGQVLNGKTNPARSTLELLRERLKPKPAKYPESAPERVAGMESPEEKARQMDELHGKLVDILHEEPQIFDSIRRVVDRTHESVEAHAAKKRKPAVSSTQGAAIAMLNAAGAEADRRLALEEQAHAVPQPIQTRVPRPAPSSGATSRRRGISAKGPR